MYILNNALCHPGWSAFTELVAIHYVVVNYALEFSQKNLVRDKWVFHCSQNK